MEVIERRRSRNPDPIGTCRTTAAGLSKVGNGREAGTAGKRRTSRRGGSGQDPARRPALHGRGVSVRRWLRSADPGQLLMDFQCAAGLRFFLSCSRSPSQRVLSMEAGSSTQAPLCNADEDATSSEPIFTTTCRDVG
ncbi:uncharacterized protein LOC119315908 [Triticum dicoccoides]|uniref:uncharacterized protein LOC119315908 n=1 Tax=Triticum dicoccoides TaxID=85692 RepID=UPI001891018B|nr:uncharacterized protein LOC119315908 [Triticum dicoccoides]